MLENNATTATSIVSSQRISRLLTRLKAKGCSAITARMTVLLSQR